MKLVETVNLPEKWEDITANQYMRLAEITEIKDELESRKQLLSFLTSLSVEVVNMLEEESIDEIYNKCSFIFNEIKTYEINDKTIFDFEGDKYGIIPQDMDFISFIETIKYHQSEDVIKNSDSILPVIIRKIKTSKDNIYILEDYDSSMNEINSKIILDNLNAVDVASIVVFFYQIVSNSLQSSIGSLIQKMEKKTGTQIDGDGKSIDGL